MKQSPFVPIPEIIAVLEAAGEHASTRTVYNDIAAGRIPGEFRVTGTLHPRRTPRVKRADWDKYLAGDDSWRPAERRPMVVNIQDFKHAV